jgi:hypothetical protein
VDRCTQRRTFLIVLHCKTLYPRVFVHGTLEDAEIINGGALPGIALDAIRCWYGTQDPCGHFLEYKFGFAI